MLYEDFLKADFEHNGIKYSANVDISVEHDDIEPDFDYGDAIENEKELQRFESGELLNTIVIVKVEAFGVTAREILGGVWLSSKESFPKQIADLVRGECMVETALTNLVENLTETANTLKPFQTE